MAKRSTTNAQHSINNMLKTWGVTYPDNTPSSIPREVQPPFDPRKVKPEGPTFEDYLRSEDPESELFKAAQGISQHPLDNAGHIGSIDKQAWYEDLVQDFSDYQVVELSSMSDLKHDVELVIIGRYLTADKDALLGLYNPKGYAPYRKNPDLVKRAMTLAYNGDTQTSEKIGDHLTQLKDIKNQAPLIDRKTYNDLLGQFKSDGSPWVVFLLKEYQPKK